MARVHGAAMKNQTVVVLGGGAGIGKAVADRCVADGARVVVGSRRTGVDLRDAEAVARLFASVGPFDHLVYTAGEELLLSPLADLDLAAARAFFELRFWGALGAVKAARPYLARTGSIVLTSGAAAHRPHPGFVVGASICAAMEGVARALAVELAPVRVNVVTPGFVDTGLWSNVPVEARTQMFADAAAKLPVGRVGVAEDIAEHYLSFMRGQYVTGQTLIVDGGGVLV